MKDQMKKQVVIGLIAALFVGVVVAAVAVTFAGSGSVATIVVGSIAAVGAFLANYFLLTRPLAAALAYADRLAQQSGGHSEQLDAPRSPLVADAVGRLGRFFGEHATLVTQLMEIGGGMATAAAEVSFASDQLKKRVHSQVSHINEIANAASIISGTVQAAVESSGTSVETAKQTRRASHLGQEYIQEATKQMEEMKGRVEEAASLMTKLEARANQIQKITGVINEIADQTNLLALNAAIEAARAGDQGRGFAVVADEVRNLAKRTTAATTEIGQMVQEINEETGHAVGTMHSLVEVAGQSSEQTAKVDKQFEEILEYARNVEGQVLAVAEGDEQNHQHLEQISSSIQSVSGHLTETENEVASVSEQALRLSDRAEVLYEAFGNQDLGTLHDKVRGMAQRSVAEIQRVFEEAVATGRVSLDDLFDRNYQPIPGTDPQKFHTRFDQFCDEVLPGIQEPLLAEDQRIVFAIPVDNNGYLPTHNKKFSQPLTGDYQTDLVGNRTKRIFDDRTGARCGSNTKPFLLQTYKRDTGEIMHDFSVPIYIKGRHWGGFRMGYRTD